MRKERWWCQAKSQCTRLTAPHMLTGQEHKPGNGRRITLSAQQIQSFDGTSSAAVVQFGKTNLTSCCPFRPRQSPTSEGSGYKSKQQEREQARCKLQLHAFPSRLMRGDIVLTHPGQEVTGDHHEVHESLGASYCPSGLCLSERGRKYQGIATASAKVGTSQIWYAPPFLVCWARGPSGQQRARQVASGSHGRCVVVDESVYLPLLFCFCFSFSHSQPLTHIQISAHRSATSLHPHASLMSLHLACSPCSTHVVSSLIKTLLTRSRRYSITRHTLHQHHYKAPISNSRCSLHTSRRSSVRSPPATSFIDIL